jgi:hypothetical protein
LCIELAPMTIAVAPACSSRWRAAQHVGRVIPFLGRGKPRQAGEIEAFDQQRRARQSACPRLNQR